MDDLGSIFYISILAFNYSQLPLHYGSFLEVVLFFTLPVVYSLHSCPYLQGCWFYWLLFPH